MDTTRTIQMLVAKVDLALCQIAAWPWKRLALSLLLAALAIHILKVVGRHE